MYNTDKGEIMLNRRDFVSASAVSVLLPSLFNRNSTDVEIVFTKGEHLRVQYGIFHTFRDRDWEFIDYTAACDITWDILDDIVMGIFHQNDCILPIRINRNLLDKLTVVNFVGHGKEVKYIDLSLHLGDTEVGFTRIEYVKDEQEKYFSRGCLNVGYTRMLQA